MTNSPAILLSLLPLRLLAATCFLVATSFCHAGPTDLPFYHQLIKLQDPTGYSPTRTFTIVTDAEHGNQLVAEDDPDLRFNMAWMAQYQPGYKATRGGAAFGQILRTYATSLYKAYRANHSEFSSALPDADGHGSIGNLSDTDYDLRIGDGEFKIGFRHSY